MPRRSALTPAQLAAFVALPTTAVEIARQYTLDARDLALIRRRRGAHNRLGFAVQLCYLRYPGQVMDPETGPPDAVLAFVAQQAGVPSASWGEYARRDETRREHALELQAAFGYRPFTVTEYRRCRGVLMELALHQQSGRDRSGVARGPARRSHHRALSARDRSLLRGSPRTGHALVIPAVDRRPHRRPVPTIGSAPPTPRRDAHAPADLAAPASR